MMKRIICSVIILFLCSLFLFGCSKQVDNSKLISTLKDFRNMTTFNEVEMVLGQPTKTYDTIKTSDGMITRKMEWRSNKGVVEIIFSSKDMKSFSYVKSIKFTNDRGEEEYFYKLIVD